MTTHTITTDSFKEVTNHNHQPGLEAVYLQGPGITYPTHPFPHRDQPHILGTGTEIGTGKRKGTFWLFVAVAVLGIAVIGLAVGLGVGLSRNHDSGSTQSSASTGEETDTPIPTTTTNSSDSNDTSPSIYTTTITATATATAGSSATSSSASSPSSICPSANNTIITQSLGAARYRIHCDSDIGGQNKETLASIVLPSFDACLALCNTMNYFQDRTDVGCTYNVAGTGSQTPGTCWCLGGEGTSVVENVGNDVAVLV
ncbi:hypothetical protein BDW59DRAFT_164138 [Aspergillus cavernicola]|uniref:Apple domain-containing protein n=1 Tax=Aspergillus cavernicola TaxID=176166 RepID=A0ABR4I0Y6_9EURO